MFKDEVAELRDHLQDIKIVLLAILAKVNHADLDFVLNQLKRSPYA